MDVPVPADRQNLLQSPSKKKRVYFSEFNILMDQKAYLPLVSGMLTASALSSPRIREAYEIMPFVFLRDRPEVLMESYDDPSVVTFSCSIWNMQLNLNLAARIKAKYPACIIVLGGPNVPRDAQSLFSTYPFVDVAVHGEGEITMKEILEALVQGVGLRHIPGITYRDAVDGRVVDTGDREIVVDLDELPSPYLTRVFDQYVIPRGDFEYQAIFESNRGCPFKCAFCYWGNGPGKKPRHFSLERLAREIEWFGQREIAYVFGADANFGMYERDMEVARFFADTKAQYGFPKTYRVCYGKNKGDRILEVVKFLGKHGLAKGGTLSLQSYDPDTLNNILRKNIKLDVYDRLQMEYNKADIPVYTELILGLPGETYGSFVKGIEDTLSSSMQGQIVVFMCQILPNTTMADPEYQKKYGIRVARVLLAEPHAAKKKPGDVIEYEDIIIETNSMPLENLKRSFAQAWLIQWLHGLRLGFYCMAYMNDQLGLPFTGLTQYMAQKYAGEDDRFDSVSVIKNEFLFFNSYFENLLKGGTQSVFLDDFGNIGWQIPEASYLRLSRNIDAFYGEFAILVKEYVDQSSVEYNEEVLDEVLIYQRMRTLNFKGTPSVSHVFSYNVAEYFYHYTKSVKVDIVQKTQRITFTGKDFEGDSVAFAKHAIWYGRRDFGFMRDAEWTDWGVVKSA